MKYLACADEALNTETGVCTAEVWVDSPSWLDAAPTVDQAQGVGGVIFGSLVILAAMKRLLKPPRETDA